MRNIYFIIFYITFYFGYSQTCSNTTITLSTQAEVNSFNSHPIFTLPGGTPDFGLIISGDDITDLTPLSFVTSLYGLNIRENLVLTNLNGLESIVNIAKINCDSFLQISNNPLLENISGLTNMSNSSGSAIDIIVSNNPELTDLNGLQGLNESYSISIDNNDSLTNLEGLNSIMSLDDFYITNNDNLISFAGTENLALTGLLFFSNNDAMLSFSTINSLSTCSTIITDNDLLQDLNGILPIPSIDCGTTVTITGNPNLTTCSSSWVCERFLIEFATIEINNNNVGCNNIQEVAFQCDLVPSNDNCSTALLTTLNESIVAYSDFGSPSDQIPSCNDVDRVDIWFVYNSMSSSLIDISVDNNYNLQLWEGNCGSLTQVANACGLNLLDDISVDSNTSYYIQVWPSNSSNLQKNSGLFNLIVQDATLSISEFNETSLVLYPNPVNSILNFRADQIISSIQVYNTLGQLTTENIPNKNQGTIDFSTFSSGLYFLKVKTIKKTEIFKVTKN